MSFTDILNLSISASWLILALVLIRPLVKGKAIRCALWALVAIRLLCPVSIESELSLLPTRELVPRDYLVMEPQNVEHSAPATLDIITNPIYDTQVSIEVAPSIDRLQTWELFCSILWLSGMGVMNIYAAYSYLSLRLRVRMAAWIGGRVWECDEIDSPFILGLLRPRIYLPSALDEETRDLVLAHERSHLSRLDHLWKPLGFGLLTVHWFNPILWLAYVLLCRDIELACDERVVKIMDKSRILAYSDALIRCTVPHRTIALCPLAFSEVGVKRRIKSILHYKKPGVVLTIAAVALCLVLAACFLTDPVKPSSAPVESTVDATEPSASDEDAVRMMLIYRPEDMPALIAPEFQLCTGDTFIMVENLLTSYHGRGHYTLEDGLLELRTDDGRYVYTFTADGDAFLYDRDRSDDIECYMDARNSAPLPDGTRFVLTNYRILASQELDMQITAWLQEQFGGNEDRPWIDTCCYEILDYTISSGTPVQSSQEHVQRLVVHVAALCRSYQISGGALEADDSGVIKASLTFRITPDGLERTGAVGTEDGETLYPFSAAATSIWDYRSESIARDLEDRCLLQAREKLLTPSTADDVANLLDMICASPAQSSNPGDYIAAHPAEYEELLKLGQDTVAYCFMEFDKGGQTGLRGSIMAIACRPILGLTDDFPIDTYHQNGQDWYDKYILTEEVNALQSRIRALEEIYRSEQQRSESPQ